MIQNCIFDLDNTLIDTVVYRELYGAFLKLARENTGLSLTEMDRIATEHSVERNEDGSWDSGELADALGIRSRYEGLLEHHVRVAGKAWDADVIGCLKTIKTQGLQVGIASNSFESTIRLHLSVSTAAEFVDFVYSAENAGHPKRNREFWQHLLRDRHLKAEECLMIGDSEREDLYWPSRMGFATIHFRFHEGARRLRERIEEKLLIPA